MKSVINDHFYQDLMKQSFLLCDYYYILNFQSSPYANHVFPIIINNKNKVIGINAFGEFLSLSDFLAFNKNGSSDNETKDLVFYSKRLNLFILEETVHFLDNRSPVKINVGEIRSESFEGKEVLRIFDIDSDPK